MQLIVGLGNPGTSYEETRHNIGFMVVDKLARELSDHTIPWEEDAKHQALVGKGPGILLVKPVTFMNASGAAVSQLVSYYKADIPKLIVVHDDLDLPLGKIRIRNAGASGGHNGITSLIESLKTDVFIRVRLGIGRGTIAGKDVAESRSKRHAVVGHVLSAFSEHEKGEMRKLVDHGVDAVRMILTHGVDVAMNRFN